MEAIGRSHVRYGVTLYQCRAGEAHLCHLWFAYGSPRVQRNVSQGRTGSGPASLKSYKSKHGGLWWVKEVHFVVLCGN